MCRYIVRFSQSSCCGGGSPPRIHEVHRITCKCLILVQPARDPDGVVAEPPPGFRFVPAGAEVVQARGPGVFPALEEISVAEGRGRKSEVGDQRKSGCIEHPNYAPPCVVVVGFGDGAVLVDQRPDGAEVVGERLIGVRGLPVVQGDREQVADAGAPGIGADEVAGALGVGDDVRTVMHVEFKIVVVLPRGHAVVLAHEAVEFVIHVRDRIRRAGRPDSL